MRKIKLGRDFVRYGVVLFCLGLLPLWPAQAVQHQAASAAEPNRNTPTTKAAAVMPPYEVQPNDVLEIYVWKDTNLTRKVIVRPDGRISFPLIQDMPVAGLTPEAIKNEIEQKLKDYIEAPNVTVIVEAIQSYRVFVTGKVGKPGAISAEKPISVLQALALAGGFLEFADPAGMVIIRHVGNENVLFRFNYVEAIRGKNFNQNMLLLNGDVIVVP